MKNFKKVFLFGFLLFLGFGCLNMACLTTKVQAYQSETVKKKTTVEKYFKKNSTSGLRCLEGWEFYDDVVENYEKYMQNYPYNKELDEKKQTFDTIKSLSPKKLKKFKKDFVPTYDFFIYADGGFDLQGNGMGFRYRGTETDGSKIKLPEGIVYWGDTFAFTDIKTAPRIPKSAKWVTGMFNYCEKLQKAPVIPKNAKVDNVSDLFSECNEKVEKAAEWNIEHRGKNYYKDR